MSEEQAQLQAESTESATDTPTEVSVPPHIY